MTAGENAPESCEDWFEICEDNLARLRAHQDAKYVPLEKAMRAETMRLKREHSELRKRNMEEVERKLAQIAADREAREKVPGTPENILAGQRAQQEAKLAEQKKAINEHTADQERKIWADTEKKIAEIEMQRERDARSEGREYVPERWGGLRAGYRMYPDGGTVRDTPNVVGAMLRRFNTKCGDPTAGDTLYGMAQKAGASESIARSGLRDESSCYHKGRWPKVGGQHQCTICLGSSYRFILECPRCRIRACASCRKQLRG